jgi:hypothetical protein
MEVIKRGFWSWVGKGWRNFILLRLKFMIYLTLLVLMIIFKLFGCMNLSNIMIIYLSFHLGILYV